jgi:hypothetical protein
VGRKKGRWWAARVSWGLFLVEEQRNQNDDRDWYANQPQQDGSHGGSFLGLPVGKGCVQVRSMVN